MQDVVGGHHQHPRLRLRFQRQRHVYGHLVAVEIVVERRANKRVQLNRLSFDQDRLERLDAEAMKRRGAIEQDWMFANNLVENVPDFRLLLLDELLRLLDRRRKTLGGEPRIDERLEQFERHFLLQPALIQLELRADHDDGAAGIIDALAKQGLPAAATLG